MDDRSELTFPDWNVTRGAKLKDSDENNLKRERETIRLYEDELRTTENPHVVSDVVGELKTKLLDGEFLDWSGYSNAMFAFFENRNQDAINYGLNYWIDGYVAALYFEKLKYSRDDPKLAAIDVEAKRLVEGFRKVRPMISEHRIPYVIDRLINASSRTADNDGRDALHRLIFDEPGGGFDKLERATPVFRLASAEVLSEIESKYWGEVEKDVNKMLVLDRVVSNLQSRQGGVNPDLIKRKLLQVVPAFVEQGLGEYFKTVVREISARDGLMAGSFEEGFQQFFPEGFSEQTEPSEGDVGPFYNFDQFREFLRSAFEGCDPNEVEEIFVQAESLSRSPYKSDAIRYIGTQIFSRTDSSDIEHQEIEAQLKLVGKEFVSALIKLMLKNKERFAGPLGALCTMIPEKDLKENKVLLDTIRKTELKLRPKNGSWYLCSDAEPRLLESLIDGAYVAVNDFLVVKAVGKMSGLCVRDYVSADGYTFIKGNWYAPTDIDTRETIKSALDNGISGINMKKGEWARMRKVKKSRLTAAGLMEFVSTQVERKPDVFPETIRGMTRQDYRTQKHESIGD